MNAVAQASSILILVGIFAGGTWVIRGAPERQVVCDPAELGDQEVCLEQLRGQTGVLWIDARSRSDWEVDGYPGSVLWNLDPKEDEQEMEAKAMMNLIDAKTVVVYCSDEACGTSRQIADRVRALGVVSDVKVLHGGWQALAEAGLVRDSSS